MNNKKMRGVELGFYLIFSLTLLVSFFIYLIIRLVFDIKMGPIILGIFFIVFSISILLLLFTINKSIKARYMFLEVILLLLLLLGIDIFLRIINFPPVYDFKHVQHRYSKLKTLVSLRGEGLKTMPFVPPDMMRRFHKEYGIKLYFGNAANSYIVGDSEDDGLIVYKSDANGFRNKSGLYENVEVFDVFLLGDSFAQGSWVPDGFTVSDYITKETGLSVYNAAYGGTGLITQLAIFLEYGLKKKPKDVILLYVEGIFFNRALQELDNVILKKYFQEQKPLNIVKENKIKDKQLENITNFEYLKLLLDYQERELSRTKALFFLSKFIHSSKVLMLIQRFTQGKGHPGGEGYPDCEKIYSEKSIIKSVFKCYKREIEKYGGRFSVVYLADTRFYVSNWPDCEYRIVSLLCKDIDIPFIDLVNTFNRQKNPKVFFARNAYMPTIGGHCNRKGYELVAREITKQLLLKKNRER